MSQNRPPRPKSRKDFEIAIICALTIEANAVLALFDHWEEDEDSMSFGKTRGDPNAYSTGVIGQHNVVLAHLPGMGKGAAGNIAAFCRMSYPEISLALVVGICGGVPFYGKENDEIVLGDVIISTGVVQYDLGKRFPDKFKTKDTLEDNLGRPGLELRSLFSKLKTNRQQGKLRIATQKHLQKAMKETNIPDGYLEGLHDNLFPADYRHKHQDPSDCTICAACNGKSDPVCDVALSSSCKVLNCDVQQRLSRERLCEDENDNERSPVGPNSETLFPKIHYGKFASGDMVIKSAEYRDQLAASKDAIGFEMESVGVWEVFPCVVIKGVSDYADSHKNDDWHEFAAASAAACTKAFLKYWDSSKQQMESEAEEQKLRETLINSLRFPEINERKNDLNPPASTTFQWKWDSFTDWLVSSESCYWITGNPGSGKSTLMKYLSANSETSEYLTKWRKDTLILSHFFWKPGTGFQQSYKGLLCSLLWELLSKNPDAVQIVHDMTTKCQKILPADWSQQELSNVLIKYCEYSSQPICLFVDGLDEALPGQDVLKTLQLLKSLTATNASVKMHELTKLDIAKYSHEAMAESTLLQPRGRNISNLASEIAILSDGIFLWAVLVTQSLIRGINNGDSSEQTSTRLRSMPLDLMELYHDILSRSAPDRSLYQRDISLVLNLLNLASRSMWYDREWHLTPFILTMITNPDLLERYVDRGDAIQESKLDQKVKIMKDTLEAAFAGLLHLKRKSIGTDFFARDGFIEQVSFSHRSARDFLLDTVEGRGLWQPYVIPQEELLTRYFKSLIADSRLISENSESELSFGFNIRWMLLVLFRWGKQRNCPRGIIGSSLELARVCFHRGHMRETRKSSLKWKLRHAGDQFLHYAASYGRVSDIRCLLDDLETTTPEGIYCLLFDLCSHEFVDTRILQLIEYILGQGYSPNWNTVHALRTYKHQAASPWFRFLIMRLLAPERGQRISEYVQMFLQSGASLKATFQAELFNVRARIVEFISVDNAISMLEALRKDTIILELNTKAVIDLIGKTSSLAWLKHNAEGEFGCLAPGSYFKVLGFNVGKDLSLSVIENQTVLNGFVEVFLIALLHKNNPYSSSLKMTVKAFQDVLEIWPPTCPLANDGAYWRGVLSRVVDGWSDHDHIPYSWPPLIDIPMDSSPK
ncbi:hypothetical protein HYE67_000251 [Fusarium culmorum]|uniref:Nucleoside phosphorylase domain-containing protein n=1 Tax=Fusarium culmorum TaxID=5516 RepID=A0A7S8CXF2_FUSCU|nr:hypothetical protein HYE67_000251 [Fusarium culmorum]